MRLVSFKTDGGEVHVGVVRGEQVLDLTRWMMISSNRTGFGMLDLIDMGDAGTQAVGAALQADESTLQTTGVLMPLDMNRLVAPIPRPRKNVMCLGRNYAEHAAESRRAWGEAPPTPAQAEYPAIFTKAPTAVIGPFDAIPFDPHISEKIDWEAELAIVIGKKGKTIDRDRALDYVFGYMVLNDVSARDIQNRHGKQFFKGKSLDGSCPTGPWIVTPDEVGDPDNLEVRTRVNGVEKQHDNTRSMIIDVAGIIESMSFGMTIEPGDIIATGTPAGVGHARNPPEFLKPGDVVECEVENIGTIRNTVE